MENRNFSEVIRNAISGDNEAIISILAQYMPLINSQSKIRGVIDEDLQQFIFLHVLESLVKFKT